MADRTLFMVQIGGPKRRTLSGALHSSYQHFLNDVKILEDINVILPGASDAHSEKRLNEIHKRMEALDEEGKKQIRSFIEFRPKNLKDIKSKKADKPILRIVHKEAAVLLNQIVNHSILSFRIPALIREMSLVYLVISFEEFVAININNTFSTLQGMISPGKTLEFEDIRDCRSKREIVDLMIEKEIDDIVHHGIDNTADRLSSILHFDLRKKPEWDKFREVFYRRNLYVHHYGSPNLTYRKKINPIVQPGRLQIDKQYLDEAYRLFRLFAKNVDEGFQKYSSEGKRSK
jgi:hypothetical protein